MKKLSIVAVALGAIVLAGCGMQQKTVTGPMTIKVGVITPLSGPAAAYGEDSAHSYEIAAENFNNSQDKYKIELIVEDGKCDGQNATSAAQKLVNVDQVKVIIGGACSSETLAAAKVTVPAGVVLLSPSASNPSISNEKDLVYRFYNDMSQSAAMADHLRANNIEKIALVYEKTDYAVGLANALKDNFGTDKIAVDQSFASTEKDFNVIAKNVAAKKADFQAIVYIPQSDATSIGLVKGFESEGLTEEFRGKILTSEAASSAEFLSQGALVEGILTTQFPSPTQLQGATVSFIDQFKAKYEIKFTDTFVLLFGEAVNLVAAGISDPNYGVDKLNDYIKSLTESNQRSGMFGKYYFNGVDAIGLQFVVKKVQNGALVDNN